MPLLLAGVLVAVPAIFGTVSAADPKREIPDYDGRGNQDADADSWVLWIPRVALLPLYVANEYLVRRPLGALVSRIERDRWSDTVSHLFTFGEGGHNLIVPTVSFDLGRLPNIGLYYSRRDMIAAGNVLRLHVAAWDRRSIHASAVDSYSIDASDAASDASDRVQARLEIEHSGDNLFFGIGPDAGTHARSRYGLDRIEGSVGYHRRLTGDAQLDAESGIHHVGFGDGGCCGDPSLELRIAQGELMAPPGYRDGYTTGFARIGVVLDSRRLEPDPGSGVYLHLHGAPSVDLHERRSWVDYGGVLGGALDLTGHRRTLRLEVAVAFVDSVAGGPIPFTEYPMLGGERMAGFVAGWMTGPSTVAAQLGYTWPVLPGLHAQTRVTTGNAFGEHLDGFAPRKLRMSGDFGLTTSIGGGQRLEVMVGVGTETLEQGSGVASVRVMLGWRSGT